MMTRAARWTGAWAAVVATAVLACGPVLAEEDAYEKYVKTSRDFKPGAEP